MHRELQQLPTVLLQPAELELVVCMHAFEAALQH